MESMKYRIKPSQTCKAAISSYPAGQMQ